MSATIAAKVRRFRQSHSPRLSQDALAELAGLGVQTVKNLEREREPDSKETPRVHTVEVVARALGVTIFDLMHEASDEQREAVSAYEQSPWSQIDKPTGSEIEWLKQGLAASTLGERMSPEAVHTLLIARRLSSS